MRNWFLIHNYRPNKFWQTMIRCSFCVFLILLQQYRIKRILGALPSNRTVGKNVHKKSLIPWSLWELGVPEGLRFTSLQSIFCYIYHKCLTTRILRSKSYSCLATGQGAKKEIAPSSWKKLKIPNVGKGCLKLGFFL